jgi:heme-degrading monooxygenase HmoA
VYIILWEFSARAGHEKEFEGFYGPQGDWARFFARGEGFLGTELLRDWGGPRRYLTLDRWESREAYEHFRSRFAAEYEALDRLAEGLTESEVHLGSFTTGESQSA